MRLRCRNLQRQFAALYSGVALAMLILASATLLPAQSTVAPLTSYSVTVTSAGTGTGTVTSSPAGISCKPTCGASFASGTQVKLTAAAGSGSYFAGWSGACKGTGACTLTVNSNLAETATFNLNQTVKVLNHIIFMVQENRGLDHYFGALRQYWRKTNSPT